MTILTSQNTFENHFTLVRNVSEKCNREMTRGNARDEPNLSRRSRSGSVACIIQNELGKAGTTWSQLLLLLLWYLIPKVVKPPPDLHHAGVEAVSGACFNQNQRRVRSGEKWRVFSQLPISATYVFGGGQVSDKENNMIYMKPASHLGNVMFRKV